MHHRIRIVLGGLLVAFAAWATAAGAQTLLGPTAYLSQSDSPFAAEITAGTVVLETFEDGALSSPFVTASAGAPFGPGGLTDSVDADDGAIDGSGTNGHSFFSGAGSTGITFTFDPLAPGGLPTRAGVVWTDGDGAVSFEAFGPGGASLGTIGPVTIADASNFGGTAEDRFFGVINPGGISAIHISNAGGGIEVDHLQWGGAAAPPPPPVASIPVPSVGPIGLVLLLLTLAVAGFADLRRR